MTPLTDSEATVLVNALDEHAYWTLSDEQFRNSGYVIEPGSDDPLVADEIAACHELGFTLFAAWEQSPSPAKQAEALAALSGHKSLLVDALETHAKNMDATTSAEDLAIGKTLVERFRKEVS